MWTVELARSMALLMLLGTLVGAGLLFAWSGFLGCIYLRRGSNEPGGLIKIAWPVIETVTQFWTVGVLLVPGLFYIPPQVLSPLPNTVQWTGVLMWGAGGALALWCTRVMGQAMRPQIVVTTGQALVRDGPYSRVRHPMYTALVLVAFGMAVTYLSLPVLVLTIALALMARRRADLEEELLSSSSGFGQEYLAYMKETGRFLPRLRRYQA